MIWRLSILIFILIACGQKNDEVFDFKNETGLSEDQFYAFINEVYSQKFDSIAKGKIIYSFAGKPIKIEFENGAPTELEPPTMDFLKASYKLDSTRLIGFKLISPKVYSQSRKFIDNDDCESFKNEIGKSMFFIYLPWFNPKDSTILFKAVENTCPPYYDQGQGVLYRFKRKSNGWDLIN